MSEAISLKKLNSQQAQSWQTNASHLIISCQKNHAVHLWKFYDACWDKDKSSTEREEVLNNYRRSKNKQWRQHIEHYMKEAAHIITGVQTASATIKISSPKKKRREHTKKNGNQSGWMRNNIWTHQMLPFSLPRPVSLALSQGVIILNGAPCYAISAVKHQRKWIIENMIFWSGGVKESFPLPAVVSPAVHWSVGSLNLSPSLRRRTTTLHYSALRHLATQTPLQISRTLLFASVHSALTELTPSSKKTASIWHSQERKRKKEEKKKGMYI